MFKNIVFLRCFGPFAGKKIHFGDVTEPRFLRGFGLEEGARDGQIGILRSFQHRWPKHGPNIGPKRAQHGPTWANIGQHRPNVGPTWAQDEHNIAQHGLNLAQHRPKMGPTWLNMGPTWPNISPRWVQGPTWPNMGTTCAQHRPRLLPYRQALRIMPASVQHSPPWVCVENLGPIFRCLAGARLSGT